MSRPDIDTYFLQIAQLVSTRGTCPRKYVGCILVDYKHRIISTGYNGVASGAIHCIDTPCPGAQYTSGFLDVCQAIHAEQNALIQCRNSDSIYTVYCTLAPCPSCAKLFLNTGCHRIVYTEEHSTIEATRLVLNNKITLVHWQNI